MNVSHCQTGIYSIVSDTSSCTSGTLCITVSGYNISAFTGITDFADRSNLGERTNVLQDSNGVKGVVRPYGSDKKFYFDFDDGAPEISNIYYIEDMLATNVLTIKTPYHSDYVGRSGIVFIIDNSASMRQNDPAYKRIEAILDIIKNKKYFTVLNKVGVYSFSDGSAVLWPFAKIKNKQTFIAGLKQDVKQGGTNIPLVFKSVFEMLYLVFPDGTV